MPTPQPDLRSERRKALDEQLASEPHLPHPVIPPGEQPRPLEGQLRHRHPVAVVGVVENGLVRLMEMTFSSHPSDPLLACLSHCPLFTATTLAT
jgi:hypothetical protein